MQAILDCGWCRLGFLGLGDFVCVETVYFCFGPQINNTLEASLLRPGSSKVDCCIVAEMEEISVMEGLCVVFELP